ncbi:MAG: T9SS type A sorting domain-containing protein [Bacteroidota bacterium]|nr:T9SS type A sorting domain-containing protein [Bacteroidota bacterium]
MKKNSTQIELNKLLLLIVLIIVTSGTCFSQGWLWAKTSGGLNNDAARAVCTDPSGNVIVAGGYSAPSMQIGTVTINSLGGGDIYLAKFDPNGNLIWVQTIGGTGLDVVGGVCTSTNGSIYLCGSYDSPTLTLASYNLTQASTIGNSDMFVAQFSSSGSVQWAFKYGAAGSEVARGCTYSSTLNNVLVTGYFNSPTFAFGVYNVSNSSTGGGSNDIFVARFNTTFGTATGAFSTGGVNSNDYGHAISVDATSIYIGGSFSPITGNTSTVGGAVTSLGSQDVFLAKYSNAQVFQWVRTGGSASTSADYFTGMDIDASGSCYLAGSYYGLPMQIGTANLTNSGTNDGFIAKYNSSGVFQWAGKVGGTGSDAAGGVTVDGNNNVYLTGYFAGTVVTVGSFSLTNTTPGSQQDVYVVKYNSTGTPQWVSSATSIAGENAYGIAADAIGNVYVGGSYNVAGPIAFGTTTLSSNGNNDSFLAKIGCLTTTISGLSNVCAGTSATLNAYGASTYTWSTGATGFSIAITPTANTTYTVFGAAGSCTDVSDAFNVTLLPANVNPGPNLNLLCNQSQLIAASIVPSGPATIAWTPTVGLSSSNVLSPTVTATSPPTQYTVTANLSNGCTATATLLVTQYAPKPDICLVSVDTLGINNEIFWEKTLYTNVDSFIVYREVSTNVYNRIAAISSSAYSGFTDTARAIGPANGDPNTTSYKYKLQIRDICGNYGALSNWHQTILIQDQQNGNFNWNPYAIESSSTPVTVYDLFRVNLSNNTYSLVTSTTAGLATDPQYNSWQTTARWRVQANGFNCNPTNKTSGILSQKVKTKSNIKNDKLVGIKDHELMSSLISTYPSPAKDIIFIDSRALANIDMIIELQNTLGQTVYSKKYAASSTEKYQIETTAFANGIYFVNIKQENKTVAVKKIIISK